MWHSPGFVAVSNINHIPEVIPGCGSVQDLAFSRIWQSPGFGSVQHVAVSRICQQHPGRGIMQDLAFSKIWRFPRFGILQDVAFSRLWQSPGPGCCRNWAQRRRKRRDPSPPTRNPGCFWVQNSVWGRRDPNARVPRALADGPVSFFDGVCAFLGNRPSLFWLGKSKPFMLWSGKK